MENKNSNILVSSDSARQDIRVFDAASGATMTAADYIASKKDSDEDWREQD